jgi:hypothetical protein
MPPDYRGIAAVILAASVGLTMVLATAAAGFSGRVLSEAGSEALIAIGGAAVGALAGWIAGRNDIKP